MDKTNRGGCESCSHKVNIQEKNEDESSDIQNSNERTKTTFHTTVEPNGCPGGLPFRVTYAFQTEKTDHQTDDICNNSKGTR